MENVMIHKGTMKTIVIEKSPLLETVCVLNFGEGKDRDDAFLEKFHNRIQSLFPHRRQDAPSLGEGLIDEEDSSSIEGGDTDGPRFEFQNDEKTVGIILRENKLAIVRLSHKLAWDEFKGQIQFVIDSYWEEAAPKSIPSLSLRYINRFLTPEEAIHYDEFLKVHPTLPPGKRDLPWIQWIQVVSVLFSDIKAVLDITSGVSMVKDPDDTNEYVFLDLTMNYVYKEPIAKNDVMPWLESAHSEMQKTFFDSLTDLSRTAIGYREEGDQ